MDLCSLSKTTNKKIIIIFSCLLLGGLRYNITSKQVCMRFVEADNKNFRNLVENGVGILIKLMLKPPSKRYYQV